MIIVYSSKPALSRGIAPHLLKKYPNKKIVFIHSMYFTNVTFDYPQNIKWKDFPYIESPQFKIRETNHWKPTTGANLDPIDITFENIKNCERLIYAGDPSSTDTYIFSQFIQKIFNKNIEQMAIDALSLYSMAEEDIFKTLENSTNFAQTFKHKVSKGHIKKYFDYNFNFNSFALLGKAYQSVNHSDEKLPTNDFGRIFISKNMLQLLYFVRQQENNGISDNQGYLISKMNKWKGTGKYDFRVRLGNAASYIPIIENLLTLKLLNDDNKKIVMTKKGQEFLDFLPKDCQDHDLPFRIELWSQSSFEESQIKMDNYLKNYFKKIKNKLKSV